MVGTHRGVGGEIGIFGVTCCGARAETGDTGDSSGGTAADLSPHSPRTALLFRERKCPQFNVNL